MKKLLYAFLIAGSLFAQGTRNNGAPTQVGGTNFAADAGSTDSYAITLSPALPGYVPGACYFFTANTANTGAASLNINGLGAKTIVKPAGGVTTTLADNDIRAGQLVHVCYDGTQMQMVSLLGNVPSSSVTGGTCSSQAVTAISTAGAPTCNTMTSAYVDSSIVTTNLPSGETMAGSLLATAITAPGTPASGKASAYVDSTSKNWAVKDDAGIVKHGVQTDTGASNNYISAISDSGGITKSRPACATLSDSTVLCSTTPGTNVAAFLITPSGANLASALSSALPNSKGGTGGDSSGSTGFAKISSGTWSFNGSIGVGDLPNSNVLISTSGAVSDPGNSADYQFNNASGALTFNAPAGVAGLQRCYRNATGKTGAITIQMAASNTVDVNGTNGSSGGTLVSGGAAGDAACIVSDTTNHWYGYIQKGSWTNN